uniref:DH domain-containing protein n=1 Tax=Arcella intermedia TaxID=1963864 RepID=A0A6B2KYZ7_9EUKA
MVVRFPNSSIGTIIWAPEKILLEVTKKMASSRGYEEVFTAEDFKGNPLDLEKSLGELAVYDIRLKFEEAPGAEKEDQADKEDPAEKEEATGEKEEDQNKKKTKRKPSKKLITLSSSGTVDKKKALSTKATKAKFQLEVMEAVPDETRSRINYRESVLFNPNPKAQPTNMDLLPENIRKQMAAIEKRKQAVPPPLDAPVLQRNVIDKLKSKIFNRLNVAFELLDKEQDYLRYLCVLLHTFKKPMFDVKEKLNITEEQVHIAFGNLEALIPLHHELLDALLLKFENWSDTQTLGDVFSDWLVFVTDPYKIYAINYHDCLTVWEDIRDKPGVKHFLESTYAKTTTSAGQLDIGAFLIKPIQRITRDYTMIFERLEKYTPPTHPDAKMLGKVMQQLKFITTEVNGATRDPQDLKYFGSTEEVYSPRSMGGYIYKKGANVRNWKYRFMKIELETRELVYYKNDNKKEKKGSIPLSLIKDVKPAIYKDKGGTERKNLFIIVTGDRTFYIQPHNQVQRLRWIEAIDFYRKEVGPLQI